MLEKLNSFTKKVSDLSDKPSLTPSELKAQFDAAPEEVRVYLNKLIDALLKTTDGDSGADNIGATTISGIDGDTVQEILESLKAKIDENKTAIGKVYDLEAWKNVEVFQNNYRNYGNGYASAGYRKKPDGEVVLRGACTSVGILEPSIMFTLPEGYRPLYHCAFPSVDNNSNHCTVIIRTDGTVTIDDSTGYDVRTEFISLDNIRFETK